MHASPITGLMTRVRGYRAGLVALLLCLLTSAPLAGLAAPPAGEATGRVVVLFQPGTSPAARAAALTGHAGGARVTTSAVDQHLAQLRVPAGQERAVAARLRADAAVRAAGVDRRLQAAAPPSEYNPTVQPNLAVINAPAAWTAGLLGGGVRIALIDSGLDTGHPEFDGGRIVAPAVFLSDPLTSCGPTSADILDDNGHGTHVAGIAAAGADNGGIVGVAPTAAIMPVKVLDACASGLFSDIIQGIRYAADRGAHVINLSLGGYLRAGDPDQAAIIAILQDVVDYAHARGSVLVAAAGNDALSIDAEPFYPAAAEHVLAVAATTTGDIRASFSNIGKRIDLAAPGADAAAPQAGIYSTMPTYPTQRGQLAYGHLYGTSMATPHVTGLAALLRERDPALTPDEVAAILKITAIDLAPAGDDPYFGAGRVDAGMALASLDPPVIRYFAEGYTGAGFDTYLTIQNVNAKPILARLGFQYAGSADGPAGRYLTLPASSRTTVAVDELVGDGRAVSITLAAASAGVYAERPMYFTYGAGITDGHVSAGAPAPAARWYFAEGYTGVGFDMYLTIQNPGAAAADVRVTYYRTGADPILRTHTVPAGARATIAVHDPAQGVGRGQAISAMVESTDGVPIVVERPMYFTYSGGITGGHNVVGATSLGAAWYFAEGYTGTGFDEYLTILNPGAAGMATITYYVEGQGSPISRTLPLPANSRTTVAVHDDAHPTANPGGLGRLGVGHATRVESTVPVAVERPMYFRYTLSAAAGGGVVTGGHNVMGAPAPASTWHLPEGYTGPGFDEYLTLLNPGPVEVPVTITYNLASGGPVVTSLMVPPGRRATVAVHDTARGVGRGQAVAARATTTAPSGIVVERAIYFTYPGGIDGGHVGLGLP